MQAVRQRDEPVRSQKLLVISLVADFASHVIYCPEEATAPQANPPNLKTFIKDIACSCQLGWTDLLFCTEYMYRLKCSLPRNAEGLCSTPHRVFLASIIVYLKYHRDVSPKATHWAAWSRTRSCRSFGFTVRQVNSLERDLLLQLNYKLRITQEDTRRWFSIFLLYQLQSIQFVKA